MYTFSAYNYGLAAGQAPRAGFGAVDQANGYLPAHDHQRSPGTTWRSRSRTSPTRRPSAATRSSWSTPGSPSPTTASSAVTVPPGQSGPNLVPLTSASDTVQPGQTEQPRLRRRRRHLRHPAARCPRRPRSASRRASAARSRTTPAYQPHGRATGTGGCRRPRRLSLPNVTLPNTGNLANPGTALDNAYKAGFVYTRIVQVGKAPFSGANNYAWLLNHDLPGILANRFELGDFTDAQNLLLTGRISEDPNFNEDGANWYWDGAVEDPGRLGRLPGDDQRHRVRQPVLPRRRQRRRASGGRACTR